MQQVGWDIERSNKELKFQDLVVSNMDQEFRLAIVNKSVVDVDSIRFKVQEAEKHVNGHKMQLMVGLCDYSVRKGRGMIFQDKSFVGHGIYGIYSTQVNSFIFSHWDTDKNYEEGGINFKTDQTMELRYNKEQGILIIRCLNQQATVGLDDAKNVATYEMKLEHNVAKDLYFCAMVSVGSVQIA